jgi:hypothetical protein
VASQIVDGGCPLEGLVRRVSRRKDLFDLFVKPKASRLNRRQFVTLKDRLLWFNAMRGFEKALTTKIGEPRLAQAKLLIL